MLTELHNPNMKALHAATMFTSEDKTRAVLHDVVILAPDLFVASNSYLIGMVGGDDETPATVIQRVLAEDTTKAVRLNGAALLPVLKTVSTKQHAGPATQLHNVFQFGDTYSTFTNTAIGITQVIPYNSGMYPGLSTLMSATQPEPVQGVAFNLDFLALLAKARKLLNHDTTCTVLWGGSATKVCYWSSQSTGCATVVMLIMPVRHNREWK